MITHTRVFSSCDARFGFVSFMAAFIWAVFAVKRLWHVLRQTFSDLPSSAISAAKRCSVLHCSGPAPTRHECQTASKVNFLLLPFICSTFSVFPFFHFITTAHTVAALFLSSHWFVSPSLQWSEHPPWALSAQQLQRWICHSQSGRRRNTALLTPSEIWRSLDIQPYLNLGCFIVYTSKGNIRQFACGHLSPTHPTTKCCMWAVVQFVL